MSANAISHSEVVELLARDDLTPNERDQLERLTAAMEAPASPTFFEVGKPIPPEATLTPAEAQDFCGALSTKARLAHVAPRAAARTGMRSRGAGTPAGRRSAASSRDDGDDGDSDDGEPASPRVYPRKREVPWIDLLDEPTLRPRRQSVLGEEVAS